MPKTEAGKRANAKWDAVNMATLGVKTRRDKAEAFKAACAAAGTSMNAIFTAAMDDFLRQQGIDPDSFSRKKD
jgi:hypothetical protein